MQNIHMLYNRIVEKEKIFVCTSILGGDEGWRSSIIMRLKVNSITFSLLLVIKLGVNASSTALSEHVDKAEGLVLDSLSDSSELTSVPILSRGVENPSVSSGEEAAKKLAACRSLADLTLRNKSIAGFVKFGR